MASLPLLTVEPDPKLLAYEGSGPAWLRWLDDKSVAAIPAAGGAVIGMDWADLCAAIAPQLVGNDADFAKQQELTLPTALERLETSLARALKDVRDAASRAAGSPSAADADAPEPMETVAAAAAECALRVLIARFGGRGAAELAPVANALGGLPRIYWDGPAAALANEPAAERAAPRAAAVAAIAGYLAYLPFGASFKHGGWIGAQLEANNWSWFEAALVPLTFTASVARQVAAGCSWSGRFSVTFRATRGRVFDPGQGR